MTSKENNKKNKSNTKKKSNVIYIDRNKKTGQISAKNTNKSVNKNNKNSAKNVPSIEKNKSTKQNQKNTIKKSNTSNNKIPQKLKKPKTSNSSLKKMGRKIKWGRVAIAVILVVALGFCGVKGIQMLKGKSSNVASTTTEDNSGNNNSSDNVASTTGDSSKNSTTKGQYDLDDEKKRQSKKYNIVVDAGHGGNDKGSIDSTETIYEKDIALQIAKKVASRLGRESDVNVIMTRTEDKYVSLEERAEIAKRANADALISIHLNAQKKYGDANGLETWYRNGATDGSKELANSVQQTTASYVEIMSRGILRNSFEILRETTMPAVLVECGFITNVSDMEKLKNPNYQDMLAEGIMQGTLTFLDEKNGKN